MIWLYDARVWRLALIGVALVALVMSESVSCDPVWE